MIPFIDNDVCERKMQTGHPLVKKATQKYTWDDYLTWPEHERWEIIDGVAYNMTPAPSVKHQIVAGNFFSQLRKSLPIKHANRL